jgi:Ni/Co efflux regulator RcnB
MKTLILTLAAATALSAGAASAQPYGNANGHDRGGRWMSINERQDQLERRIDRGVQRGDLTRGEAYRARAHFNEIARLEVRYRRNGLSNWERADLDRRFDVLAQQIRWDRRDDQRRYGRNDYPTY